MLEDLPNAQQIATLTDDLLKRADAMGRWPTPVNDIVAAGELEERDDGPLSESWLRRAPQHLRAAVEIVRLGRVRAVLDRRDRAVYLDPSIEHEGRRSFIRLHETCHHLFDWQQDLAFADDDLTLSWRAKQVFEREANQGAAQLLFQGKRFEDMAAEYRTGIGAVSELANTVGASLQATLRQYAEMHRREVCGLVLEPSPRLTSPLTYRRREVSQSQRWTARFGSVWPTLLSADAFPFLGAIGAGFYGEYVWPDLDSRPVAIGVEAVSNQYAVLLLLSVPQREMLRRKRTVARAA